MVAGMDFTLGRFVPQEHAAKYMRTSCKLHCTSPFVVEVPGVESWKSGKEIDDVDNACAASKQKRRGALAVVVYQWENGMAGG